MFPLLFFFFFNLEEYGSYVKAQVINFFSGPNFMRLFIYLYPTSFYNIILFV